MEAGRWSFVMYTYNRYNHIRYDIYYVSSIYPWILPSKNHVNSLYPSTKAPTHVAVRLPGPLWIPASRAAMQWWAKRAPEFFLEQPTQKKKKTQTISKKYTKFAGGKNLARSIEKLEKKKREKKKNKTSRWDWSRNDIFPAPAPSVPATMPLASPAHWSTVGFSCEKYTDSIQIKWIQYKSHIIS